MFKTSAIGGIVLKCAFFSALALPACASIVIPSSEWGGQTGQVFANVPNFYGNPICNLSSSISTCSESIASNLPPQFPNYNVGTASGSVTASLDANGAHLTALASSSGEGSTTTTGTAYFYDTETNNTAAPEQFQITFHLDATLFTRSSAVAQLQLDFRTGYNGDYNFFQKQLNYGGSGTYDFINQDYTTPLQTIAPNSSLYWSIVLNGTAVESSVAGAQYLGGLPYAFIDAGNTLSMTSFSVFDAQGNPLPTSALASTAGFDYNNVTTAPEPASAALFAGPAILLALCARKRRKREL
jgi:hypothetical protein